MENYWVRVVPMFPLPAAGRAAPPTVPADPVESKPLGVARETAAGLVDAQAARSVAVPAMMESVKSFIEITFGEPPQNCGDKQDTAIAAYVRAPYAKAWKKCRTEPDTYS